MFALAVVAAIAIAIVYNGDAGEEDTFRFAVRFYSRKELPPILLLFYSES